MAPEGWRVFLQSWSAREPVEADPASVVTTIAPRANGPAIRKQITSAADTVPPIPRDRASLVRELQRELRRVGCYDGRLNESWTASTRTAMKAFTNRVNASLPIDRPDHILLTLVRGHQGRACGIACPPRQSLNSRRALRANCDLCPSEPEIPPAEDNIARRGETDNFSDSKLVGRGDGADHARKSRRRPNDAGWAAGEARQNVCHGPCCDCSDEPWSRPHRAASELAKTQHVRADLLQEAQFLRHELKVPPKTNSAIIHVLSGARAIRGPRPIGDAAQHRKVEP